jgi:hypothetical protein
VAKYGFYMHVFSKPDAVIHQLQSLRRLYVAYHTLALCKQARYCVVKLPITHHQRLTTTATATATTEPLVFCTLLCTVAR